MVVRATLRFFAGPVAGLLAVFMLGFMSPDPTGITVFLVWGGGFLLLGVPLGVAFATGRLETRNTLVVIGGGQVVAVPLLMLAAIGLVIPRMLLRTVGVPSGRLLPGWGRILLGLAIGAGATAVGLVVAYRRFLDDGETLRPSTPAGQGS